MDSVAADGADCAISNGGVTMEGDSSNGNGTSENLEGCSTQYPMEASEVGDLKFLFCSSLFAQFLVIDIAVVSLFPGHTK